MTKKNLSNLLIYTNFRSVKKKKKDKNLKRVKGLKDTPSPETRLLVRYSTSEGSRNHLSVSNRYSWSRTCAAIAFREEHACSPVDGSRLTDRSESRMSNTSES